MTPTPRSISGRGSSHRWLVWLVAALACGASGNGAAFAAETGPRWAAWVGCWQLLDERVDAEVAATTASTAAGTRVSTALDEVLVCVTPTDGAGATLRTFVRGVDRLQQTIVADGTPRPLTEPQCQGTERSHWSAAGVRLFAQVALQCVDRTSRQVSGLSFIAADRTWVDVQVVATQGRDSVRVRRYRRAPKEAMDALGAGVSLPAAIDQAAAIASAAKPFTLEDVIEASAQTAPRAVEAALVEANASFTLSSKRLVQLADGGVPEPTIDLMVALSYPERFVVDHRGTSGGLGGLGLAGPFGTSMWLEGAALTYLGQYYWHAYSPFGYSYWGGYDPQYYGSAGFVVLDPATPQASGSGRVVDGMGYTRIRPREAEPVGYGGGSGGVNGTQSSGGNTSGGNSGGGVSSQGYSGGGGGGDRTAVPRPPGA